jgi:smad nuclear-interacting protein 1
MSGIGKKRKNRWGTSNTSSSSGASLEVSRQQVNVAGVIEDAPSAAFRAVAKHVVEPYVSDSEAMAALLAAASTDNSTSNRATLLDGKSISMNSKTTVVGSAPQSKDLSSKWNTNVKPITSVTNSTAKRLRIPSQKQMPEGHVHRWGNFENTDSVKAESQADQVVVEKEKPNFAVSGALAADTSATSSRMYKGILLKFQEPPEARIPAVTKWRLYVFNSATNHPEIYHVSKQSAYLFGREHSIADIPLSHHSCSKQHAVLQYRAIPTTVKSKTSKSRSNTTNDNMDVSTSKVIQCKPYLMDLESTNGTFINGQRIEDARYYELHKGDVLKFGHCSQEYVLISE